MRDDLKIGLVSLEDVPEYHAAAGSEVGLPCGVAPPSSEDGVALVLWYRGDSGEPVVSLDARSGPPGTQTVSPELGSRASLRLTPRSAELLIRPVLGADQAEYRCRVDFRRGRTQRRVMRLFVSGHDNHVPPKQVYIVDASNQTVTKRTAPVKEGDALELSCHAVGGRPPPEVTWWRDNRLLDGTYSSVSAERVVNRLELPRVSRQDLLAALSCRASNSNLTHPASARVELDLLRRFLLLSALRPLDVRLDGTVPQLSAGHAIEVSCRSTGSRPPARLTWLRGEAAPEPARIDPATGASYLTLVPVPEDHGRTLRCRSRNPSLPSDTAIEAKWTMDVLYSTSRNIEWPKWRKRFERYLVVSGMKKKEEADKIDLLMYLMGDRADDIFRTFRFEKEEEATKIDSVLKAFDSHFCVRKNIIYERAKFNSRIQEDREPVDEFITSLYKLADSCEFESFHEQLIRDRIVVGVRDKALSERMQLDSELTLEKAVKMVRQQEAVRQQQVDLQRPSTGQKVNQVRFNSRILSPKQQQQPSRKKEKSAKTRTRCPKCGGFTHREGQACRAEGQRCNLCSKTGHFANCCPDKHAKTAEVKAVSELDEEIGFLLDVSAVEDSSNIDDDEAECRRRWRAEIQVNGKQVKFKLDSQADVTCVPLCLFKRIMGQHRLVESDINIRAAEFSELRTREVHPMPVVEHMLGQLGKARFFSKLDANSGFHQIPLSPDCQHLTTFITPFGRYKFCRIPFGISLAPEYFQRVMSIILQGMNGVMCYLDDILIFASDSKTHDRILRLVFRKLKEAKVTLNKAKCVFGVPRINFLGHILDGIRPDPAKIEAVAKMPAPTDVHGVRRFLGMVNHLGRFVENLSGIVAPLNQLLVKGQDFVWDCSQERAFRKLKELLTTQHILAAYDVRKPTMVSSDAYSYRLGAVLKQEVHIPGKELLDADALSRQPLLTTEGGEDERLTSAHINAVLSCITDKDEMLTRIFEAQHEDTTLKAVVDYLEQGWPDKKKMSQALLSYWHVKDELGVQNGLLMRSCRLVIPASMKLEILDKLHAGHFEITKKKRLRARETVWWPGISEEIAETVRKCSVCIQEAVSKHEPLISTKFPTRPSQKIGMDLFKFENKWYLVVIDYYSRFPEMIQLDRLTANVVVRSCKSIFARHGIPETVLSDNGTQFGTDREFANFARQYGFTHVTSSPRFPQSNGMAEAGVKQVSEIAKLILKKNQDPSLGLLEYRSTPLENGYSPAELLMGHKLRTTLPIAPANLNPRLLDSQTLKRKEERRRKDMKSRYDRRCGARDMEELSEVGTVRRNRFHLRKGYTVQYPDDPSTPTFSGEELVKNEKTQVLDYPSNDSDDGQIRTRSGRIVKPVDRLHY
ncbi:K02A2.6-like [Cordylochernes scorpioides]|uniref:RNA-directed DNA polymerase n=1 Tax=Cordylochernes scorpioides TaxID=51811 RepID=A0ABY6KEL1_9ARAC|nr:K02A2.6-like [Cordylochernes scorpioides]